MKQSGFYIILFLLILLCNNYLLAQSRQVLVSTNMGNMSFMLYDDTPNHRDAFIELIQSSHFDGTLFYRVIQGFVIQGGSKDSRNAYPGKHIGYGDPERTVPDEILEHHICKKGALCAPRQPNDININKQSDISQFFIIQGRTYRMGQLDTMEIAVNRPIRNQIITDVYSVEKKALFKQLKEEKRMDEARELADKIKTEIETRYQFSDKTLNYDSLQRVAYTTIGGTPELENEYTVFGEIINGIDVIDKIAKLKTDANDRPLIDLKMSVKVIK